MNPNHLRPPNLVLFTKENKIAEIGYHNLCLLSANPATNDYEPVPLTEPELLKLGFNTDYKPGYIGIDVAITDFVLTHPKVLGEFQTHFAWQITQGGVPLFKQFEYVHQLQNLFFDLWEKELIYNPQT